MTRFKKSLAYVLLLALLGLQLHGVAHLLEGPRAAHDCPACDLLLHQVATVGPSAPVLPDAPLTRVTLAIASPTLSLGQSFFTRLRGPPAGPTPA